MLKTDCKFDFVLQQEDDNDSCGSKRGKAISPGSMTLPTMNNWDMNQALSPYLPPDMNTIANGSMMTSSYGQGNRIDNVKNNSILTSV
jgi:zinc finger MIZ domain-containing protein